jgi:hypothetical protein
MTSMSNMSMTLTEFASLLDIYGGERARWPADARAAAAQLVAKDADARQLLAEAEALDRVLQSAPVPALAAEAALAERIVTAALRSPRMVKLPDPRPADGAGTEPVQLARLPTVARERGRAEAPRWRLSGRQAGAVGFLVASLFVGVVIGDIVPELADLAGLGSDRGGLVQVALSDEVMQ